jgi:PPIC-type PPIASE domain
VRPGDPVVARVDGIPITVADIAAQMAANPGLEPRRALDERIAFEVLARAAAEEELPPPTSDERAALVAVEAQRLIEHDFEPKLARSAISDGDVRSLYERGKRRFVHGALVQIAVAHIFTGARMRPEPRARAEQNARLLQAALAARPPHTAAELEAVAREPIWVERNVGVTTVWQEVDANEPFPTVVGRALASLRPGALTTLLGDETGYYVVLCLAQAPPENRSLADVAPGLRAEMFEPWRRHRFMELTANLTTAHDIEVFPDALNAASAAPPSDGTGPLR